MIIQDINWLDDVIAIKKINLKLFMLFIYLFFNAQMPLWILKDFEIMLPVKHCDWHY